MTQSIEQLKKQFPNYNYSLLNYSALTQPGVVYELTHMKGFDRNLKYFNTDLVKEMIDKIKTKIIEGKSEDEIKNLYLENTTRYNPERLFLTMIPILDEFFVDIEKDVDNIYILMQQDTKYQLFTKSNGDNYKLNNSCLFFKNIEHNGMKLQVNPKYRLNETQVIPQTKEFIRCMLISITIYIHGNDRNGSFGAPFVYGNLFFSITEPQESGSSDVLRHFAIIFHDPYFQRSGKIINEIYKEQEPLDTQSHTIKWLAGKIKTNSFTINRIIAGIDTTRKIYQDGCIGSYLALRTLATVGVGPFFNWMDKENGKQQKK